MVGRCQLCQNKAKRVVLVYKWRSVAYNVGKNMIKTGDQHTPTLKSLPVLRQQKSKLVAIKGLQRLQPASVASPASSDS
jgi:hypothetical protein